MSEAKAALVTGASRLQGIGAATCIALAKAGYDIFFHYWPAYDEQQSWGYNQGDPDQLKASIVALGRKCDSLQVDLTQQEAPGQLLDAAFSCFSYLNVLVNNAAHASPSPLEELTGQVLDKHYQLNIRSTTLLCVEFIKRYQLGNGGRIINLVSGQSLCAMTEEIAYALTKGALQTLTHTLSPLLMRRGITINAVNPGPTDTGWMPQTLKQELVSRFPAQRVGLPEDAARVIVFLASLEAAWITGQTIHSEGGFLRG